MSPESAFDIIVVPALLDYADAERELSRVCVAKEDATTARAEVLRKSRVAVGELHQFADRVFKANPPLPSIPQSKTVSDLRKWVEDQHCVFMGGTLPMKDVTLLHDLADSFKHYELDPRPSRRVLSETATQQISTGYGQLAFGEGKWGGVEQAIVTKLDGKQRAVSSILLNAANAWLVALGRPRDAYLMSPGERP